ncbi:MAG TPA: hypothetical protein VN688_00030 [Gemmataceae bacterium]|nr:hypothetical protein [Gemmataceae bacterium]
MSEVLWMEHRQDEVAQEGEASPMGLANSQVRTTALIVPAGNAPPNGPANKTLTLNAVLTQINEREVGLRRDRFPLSQIRVDTDRLIASDKEYRLGSEGLRRLCKRFQAPADYLVKLSPKLRAAVLQEHFVESRCIDGSLTDKTSYILSRDGSFLDLGRSDLFTLDNAAVVQAVREGVGDAASALEVHTLHLDDESFTLDVVSPQIAEEVRPGDVLHGGVHVRHSQLDGQATQVMAYVNRLVCRNGLVRRQCLGEKRRCTPRTRRLPSDRPAAREMQSAQIRKLVADTWSSLGQQLAAIRHLRDKAVQVRAALERFLRQAHLFSRTLMDRLLQAWETEGGEASAFGALNALTRVATHSPDLPPWQRQRLFRLAGVYANQDVHLCPHCFSILATR